jgi:hypothetical protein
VNSFQEFAGVVAILAIALLTMQYGAYYAFNALRPNKEEKREIAPAAWSSLLAAILWDLLAAFFIVCAVLIFMRTTAS